jgi:hypothetical protein
LPRCSRRNFNGDCGHGAHVVRTESCLCLEETDGHRNRSYVNRQAVARVECLLLLGRLLEVYDNIIGDQFISPLINPIPGADFTQIHDLPYMFLLIVGVALVRKPGCVTAMVFVNYLLAQLLFGSGHRPGATRGLRAAVDVAGNPWTRRPAGT